MPCCPNIARNGTEAEWAAADPVLREGEFGFVTDTGELFVGDGVTPWSGLSPIGGSGVSEAAPYAYIRAVYGSKANVGWSSVQTGTVGNEPTYLQTADGNVGHSVTWDFNIEGSTYDGMLSHHTGTNRGIYTVLLDGVSIGTIDGYAGSPATGVRTTLSNIVVQPGRHELTFSITTRNGLSSAFFGTIEAWTWVRKGP